ncbi:extracellular solute-binding protein family 5 [Dethiosulfovibrio peptidovorans DSM 11002]|uniref:Extracellular solute-binding protein family 5 n=1 Tax=Dethiosulfovibrio peptidovorans DSM 11002 TaxID=469381 RepID=D2Z8T2_9BACT|nr:ABC transporter substrate-binding protein [Dethiosulfovibrio peptidovorans]EFC91879.1 extracellular solute-binding protein family 5 [Dethiosulfovibrio peptidovorans DSM 11002]
MRKRCLLALTVAATVLTQIADASVDPDRIQGPSIDELYMVVIKDPDARALALEKGEVDLIGDIASPAIIDRLSRADDRISMSMAKSFHALSMGMNLRRNPWNRVELRRAINTIIPRERLVRELFGGFSEPLYSYLPPVSPYHDPEISQPKYDRDKAREMLRASGWSWNDEGALIPPESSDPLKPVSILSPTANSAPTTAELASRIADEMTALGIPTQAEPMDFSTMLARLDARNFDCYVMAWSLTRDPDVLYSLYHSSMDVPGGYNLPGVRSSTLDESIERLRYAPDEESAMTAAHQSQKLLSELVPVVPIYSRSSVGAVGKGWSGTVATTATSVDSIWTLLSAYRDGHDRFKMALEDDPRAINPFTSSSATAWKVLGLIYDSLIEIDPTTLGDRPGLAESWKVETVTVAGGEVTRITFKLKEGLLWQDGSPLTSSDPAETIRYIAENEIPRFFDNVSDLMAVETPDESTLTVTMDSISYWHFHHIAGLPVLPAKVLRKIDDWKSWQPMEDGGLIGSGPFVLKEYRPGEFVRFSSNEHYRRYRR